jgi:SWI/SNF-related matrix-associated actin-dependent regulator of chromatin subfamily A member 5
VIFSGFTKMLDLVEELLFLRGGDGSSFRSMRIDGATCRARRNLGIRMFNDLSSDYRVMLISTRAGGLGINLATASDVVLLDQDWNPQISKYPQGLSASDIFTKPDLFLSFCSGRRYELPNSEYF